MKILIFGAGGVGSVIGGFLARTGHEVSLLGQASHLEAIRKNGLLITGIWGDYRIKAFDLYADVELLKKAAVSFDLIILSVKSHDTQEAVFQLSGLMDENTMLLSLQEDLADTETILKKVRPENFLAGRAVFGVEILPGVVRVTACTNPVFIAPAEGFVPKLSAERMALTLSAAKIPATSAPLDKSPNID